MIVPSYAGTYPQEKYNEKRKTISNMMTDNIIESQEFSLGKNYLCLIDLVETKRPGIKYTSVNLFNKNELIIKTERNAYECWICLIDDHPVTKKDYFMTGEDYQGYSVYNLTDRTGVCYYPNDVINGLAFIWHEVIPSPSGTSLAVIGSYLNSDLELAFYDFTDPSSLPLKEINRHHFIEFDEIEGWHGEEIFALKTYRLFRKSDKKPFEELPASECEMLMQIPGAVEEIIQIDKYSKTVQEKDT